MLTPRATAVALWGALLIPGSARAIETVRIAVAEDLPAVEVEGPSLQTAPWDEEDHFDPLHSDKVRITERGGMLALDGKVHSAELRFRSSGIIRVKGFAMRGTVDLRAGPRGILVVNAIPLEDYLAAVLGGEMPPAFPPAALEAQAIAARTYAIQRKIDSIGKPYHMGATVLSQVYGGAAREDPRTRAAVSATTGEVLTYDMAPIEAYFHASCGGQTETGRQALGRDLPYLQSVPCPCGKDPHMRWEADLDEKVVSRALHMDAEKLRVAQRSRTGRAMAVTDGTHTLDAVAFRRILGYERIKSLSFDVAHSGHSLELSGRGSGHGAGMCQVGAKMLAEQGWSYQQILEHYYPGTTIQRMY